MQSKNSIATLQKRVQHFKQRNDKYADQTESAKKELNDTKSKLQELTITNKDYEEQLAALKKQLECTATKPVPKPRRVSASELGKMKKLQEDLDQSKAHNEELSIEIKQLQELRSA